MSDKEPTQPSPPTPPTPPNTPIATKADSGVVMMDKLPKQKAKTHWRKTSLKVVGKVRTGEVLAIDSDKLGRLILNWKNKDQATQDNLLRIIKGDTGLWRVQWLEGEDGTKFIVKIYSDVQYSEFAKAKNQNRKLMSHGFATQNMWLE